MASVLILSSGGINSAVAAAKYARDDDLTLLHVDYGQAAAAAQRVALGALTGAFPSAHLVGVALPHMTSIERSLAAQGRSSVAASGSTAELNPLSLRGLLPTLLSVAAQCAMRTGASTVVTGVNESSVAASGLLSFAEGQPHRGAEFFQLFSMLVETMTPQRASLTIDAPLLDLTKEQALKLAMRWQVPLERTRSCDLVGTKPCGRCAGCGARAQAFAAAGLVDPLLAPVGV